MEQVGLLVLILLIHHCMLKAHLRLEKKKGVFGRWRWKKGGTRVGVEEEKD